MNITNDINIVLISFFISSNNKLLRILQIKAYANAFIQQTDLNIDLSERLRKLHATDVARRR